MINRLAEDRLTLRLGQMKKQVLNAYFQEYSAVPITFVAPWLLLFVGYNIT